MKGGNEMRRKGGYWVIFRVIKQANLRKRVIYVYDQAFCIYIFLYIIHFYNYKHQSLIS